MDGVVFVGLVTVALVDAVKDTFPNVHGKWTVLAAGLVGGLIALLSGEVALGITELTFAEGVAAGLGAAGAVGVAKRVG